MDTVFTDDETIVVTLKHSLLIPATAIGETMLIQEEPVLLKSKRFGVADLWEIHSGKRHANVYPSRVFGM